MTVGLCQWIVLAVACQRLAEVLYADRNTRRLLAAGGREYGAGHYPLFFILHGAWLLSLWLGVPPDTQPFWPLLTLFAILQLGRLWVIHSLGKRWTTRIIALPGATPVRRGPYRWMRHPNYAIVALELAVLPLAFGAIAVAVVFSVLNGLLLAWRIRVETAAMEAQSR